MGKKICIPIGEFASDDDKLEAMREALKQRLLKDGKVAFKEESYHIESKDEASSFVIPKGLLELRGDDFQPKSGETKNEEAFTHIDDDSLKAKREALRQKLINGGKVELRKPEIASDDVTPDVTNDNVLKAKREALRVKLMTGRAFMSGIYIPYSINYGFAYVRSSSLIRDTFIGCTMAQDIWRWMAEEMQYLARLITTEDVCDSFFWYKIFVDHLQMKYYESNGIMIPVGVNYGPNYLPKIGLNSCLEKTYLGDVRVDDLCNWIAEIMRDITQEDCTQEDCIDQIVSPDFWRNIFNDRLFAKYEKEQSS